MSRPEPLEIFCAVPPGFEPLLLAEAQRLGLGDPRAVPGGITITGGWDAVMRANLWLRGASRVLVRVAGFRALHLAQLDKRARKVAWGALLRDGQPVRIDTTCRKSRIYHAGAATDRIARAIEETSGARIDRAAGLRILARIDDDLCTLSLDTSGAPLHQRGHKQAVGKAPLRETLAALCLQACAFDGAEPVADPMCGSGTLPIEAAEIALGAAPGRSRAFAFEMLAGHDARHWDDLRAETARACASRVAETAWRGIAADRDDGAIRNARANAERAGVADLIDFRRAAISDFQRPGGAAGLVIVNPPYGDRIGNRKLLFALYGTLGQVLRERFAGWRVGLITSDAGLARATELPFLAPGPVISHGGLGVRLYRTEFLP